MILSDIDILNSMDHEDGIRIDPFDEQCVQPASYDLHLGDEFMYWDPRFLHIPVDPRTDHSKEMILNKGVEMVLLRPRDFVLGVTMERVRIPLDISGRLDGKSSLARLGLSIHTTGGNIDPGNWLNITLEMYNQSQRPLILRPGMPIGQIVFQRLQTKCLKGYDGKYLNSLGVEPSQMHLNFKTGPK